MAPTGVDKERLNSLRSPKAASHAAMFFLHEAQDCSNDSWRGSEFPNLSLSWSGTRVLNTSVVRNGWSHLKNLAHLLFRSLELRFAQNVRICSCSFVSSHFMSARAKRCNRTCMTMRMLLPFFICSAAGLWVTTCFRFGDFCNPDLALSYFRDRERKLPAESKTSV